MEELVDKQEAQSRTVLASTGFLLGPALAHGFVEKSLPSPSLQSGCGETEDRDREREGAGRGWQTCSWGHEGLGWGSPSRVRAWVWGTIPLGSRQVI